MTKSALQIARAAYQPKLPKALKGAVKVKEGEPTQSVADQEAIKALFPNTYGMPLIQFVEGEAVNMPAINVGVILSGGQAPGGHNVISGLFDGIKALNKDSKLYGFILGPGGLVDHNYMELTSDIIDEYRNTGGFDIIGSGRTKLEKVEQFDKGLEIIKELGIKALVIIGGDDSNTNACVLAEYYAAKNCGVQVIGCPKTIDGDLKNEMIETSFGFDTACKTYSEVIGNIQRDCNSARKYWHFIKLMGGIPVDRSRKTSLVDQMIKIAKSSQKFHLAITPEGTRKANPNWKKGFYYIAQGAGLPIILVAIDYEKKCITAEKVIHPSGDLDKDMREVKLYYKNFKGKYPENFSIGKVE
jgi:hypothetical protein